MGILRYNIPLCALQSQLIFNVFLLANLSRLKLLSAIANLKLTFISTFSTLSRM